MAQELTNRIRVPYRLEFLAPFHVGSGLRRGLVHRAVMRDAAGFLFVPGSTLKGVARESCERIAGSMKLNATTPHRQDLSEFVTSGIVDEVFGSRARPGTVYFDDAPLAAEEHEYFSAPAGAATRFSEIQVAPRTRVRMSRQTGTAVGRQLFTSEYGLAGMPFDGVVKGVIQGVPVDSEPRLTYGLVLLVAGMLSVDSIGGERSCGAGTCALRMSELVVDGVPYKPEDILVHLEYLELYDLAKES